MLSWGEVALTGYRPGNNYGLVGITELRQPAAGCSLTMCASSRLYALAQGASRGSDALLPHVYITNPH